MKKMVIVMCCLMACRMSAVESEIQFENDQVRASKIKIVAHEEIGLHRDDYPRLILSFKGGTITRLEGDGSTTDVELPKGEVVFLEADPLGQLHRTINKTCKPIELFVIELKASQALKK